MASFQTWVSTADKTKQDKTKDQTILTATAVTNLNGSDRGVSSPYRILCMWIVVSAEPYNCLSLSPCRCLHTKSFDLFLLQKGCRYVSVLNAWHLQQLPLVSTPTSFCCELCACSSFSKLCPQFVNESIKWVGKYFLCVAEMRNQSLYSK